MSSIQNASTPRRRRGTASLKIIVPVAVAIVGYVAFMGYTRSCAMCTAVYDTVTGRGAAAAEGATTLSADAGAMHRVVLRDPDGTPFTLGERANGRPMLVEVWATWCAPCRVVRKTLNEHADELTEVGTIVCVSLDKGGPDVVRAYLEKTPGDPRFVEGVYDAELGDVNFREVLRPFETQATIPKIVYVDRNGNVQDIEYGLRDPEWAIKRLRAMN